MTRGRVGGRESAEHQPTPPWSSQRFLDRKMDGPKSINNYTPLTMAPKLLTLQLPPNARTTRLPQRRSIVLGTGAGNQLLHPSSPPALKA